MSRSQVTAMPLQVRIETVASVRSRQSIWADWMRKATEGLAEDDLVETHTKVSPCGCYLIAIVEAPEEGQR